jgi:hypothetical protein
MSDTETYHTYGDWKKLGYHVNKGEKSKRVDGVCLFSDKQIDKDVKLKRHYSIFENYDPTYDPDLDTSDALTGFDDPGYEIFGCGD